MRRGLAHVPEGRGTSPPLTVEENLRLGAYARSDDGKVRDDMRALLRALPAPGGAPHQRAGHAQSGGEQQMLAIARGLMLRPRLMLLDEPSLGLVAADHARAVQDPAPDRGGQGTAMLIVEQNANLVLEFADAAYVLETGRLVLVGHGRRDRAPTRRSASAYLGMV